MKRDEKRAPDWLDEVWRVKEELAAEAERMGLREYVAFAEKEADRIMSARSEPATTVARDRPSK
jgi:hypothetical protein